MTSSVELAAAPVQRPTLDAAERHRLLREWNDTASREGGRALIHELFSRQARQTPAAVAVEHVAGTLSYGELERSSDRLADDLRRQGVGPEVAVGVYLDRSPELIVALLGILKAGGAYLPLDPSYPPERSGFMLRDAGVSLVVGGDRLPAGTLRAGVRAVPVREGRGHGRQRAAGPPARLSPEGLAYVMYTSGSTGRPKGTRICHRSVVRLVREAGYASLGRTETLLHFAPISFDASTFEIWGALLNGGRLVVMPAGTPSLRELGQALERHRITTLWLTSALFQQVVESELRSLRGVRQLLTGGDVVPVPHARRVLDELPGLRLINGFGPTENTTFTCCHPMGDARRLGSSVSIGRPIGDTQVYLADERMDPVPAGEVGELYAGGVGLARDYLGHPSLTAERFVPHPWSEEPGARLYRVGDRARHLPDGRLEFLGRLDHQVKLRGFRVEPGEVEAVLLEHPAVLAAAVVVQREGDDPRLVAFLVPHRDDPEAADGAGLRRYLEERLPPYMVPSALVELEALPLNPNGKVDRAALARRAPSPPAAATGGGSAAAPRNPTEELLAGVWADVLGRAQVGIHDDFIALGGHSLLALRAAARAGEVLGVELPLRALFEHPTVAALAEHLERAAAGDGRGAPPPIEPVARDRALPLSLPQQRLWFLHRLRPEDPSYNVALALDLTGTLAVPALAAALAEVVRRHEALRTRFPERAGQGTQIVDPPALLALPVVDLGGLPAARRSAESHERARAEARRPFDLARGPVLRALLLKLDERRHRMVLTLHHVVCDAWSIDRLLAELAELHDALRAHRPPSLEELPIQYADYALWQRRWLESGEPDPELDGWRRHLAGSPEVLELPVDRPRPPHRDQRGGRVRRHLPATLRKRLAELGRRRGMTPFMILLAAFDVLLVRATGVGDLLVGFPIAGRRRRELEPLVGFFVNTLVQRVRIAPEHRFSDLLRQVREVVLEASTRQDVPFERLVEELRPERSPSHAPLVQVMFNSMTSPALGIDFPGLDVAGEWIPTATALFDLMLEIEETPRGLAASIEYSSQIFDRTTAARLLRGWERLLGAALDRPAARLAELELLDAAERHQLTAEWNDTASRGGGRASIHRTFSRQARREPEAVAVVHGSEHLSYGELERISDRLAAHLRRQGVGPEVVVGLAVDRSLELTAALLGILKAGGAYLPLDPSHPPERLRFVLEDAGVTMAVAAGGPSAALPVARTVAIDGRWRHAEASGGPSLDDPVPEQLAYVIYTSGSTGRPKGTRICHRSVVRLVQETRWMSLSGDESLLQFAPISFDASTFEIWGALLNGGRLVVMPAGTPSLHELGEALERHRITTLWLTSALFQQMVESELRSLRGLRQLLTGGDVVPAPHARRVLAELPGLCLINGFGPTENTTFTCCHPMRDASRTGSAVSIGRPIGDTGAHVLDRRLHPAPIGVAGELFCAGAGLARDYLERPALTAERFVPCPWSAEPGARLYRTGDRARHLADGRLDFLGRYDQQVKIRGFRVEPAEVEALLLEHPRVRAVAVVVQEEGPGGRRLAAFVVPEESPEKGSAELLRELSRHLEERLPSYMVPAAMEPLDALPLTANGKVDRRALARRRPAVPAGTARSDPDALPRTPAEELLAGIWAEVLGESLPADRRIGRNDSFFELGGHSLLATRISSRVREVFALELPLQQIFEAPTVAELAALLAEQMAAGGRPAEPAIERAPRDRPLPLSFAQERLWFLDRLDPGKALYNVPLALDLRGPLAVAALAAALAELTRRHEVLRTLFAEVAGRPQATVLDPQAPPLPVVDLSALDEPRRSDRTHLESRRWARLPFDLAAGLPMRSLLLRRGRREHRLVLSLHHAVCDGWSIEILLRELPALYTALRQGAPSPLPELAIQYGDFALWQRRRLESGILEPQLDDWRRQLAGSPEVLDLPTDRPRPPRRSLRGSRLSVEIPPELRDRVLELARRRGTTLFMAFLAAFDALLFRHTGGRDLPVGCPVAGRGRRQVEPLVGLFVNTLVLRTPVTPEQRFEDLLRQVRETVLRADAHQDVPFERLVEELRPERSLSRSPLFQVTFAYHTTAASQPPWPEIETARQWIGTGTSKFDLALEVLDSPAGCEATIEYSTELFDETTIRRLAEHLESLLAELADHPRRRLCELPLSSAGERHQLLVEWAGGGRSFPRDGAIHRLLEARAERTPDAVAITWDRGFLTYRQVAARADRLARRLRELGIGPEVSVGLTVARGPAAVVGLWGILAAGGACVPLDPAYPADRLAFMLRDAGCRALVTDGETAGSSEDAARLPSLRLDLASADVPATAPASGRGRDARPGDLAYVIYTSGSTGTPKGVAVTHGQALPILCWGLDFLGLDASTRVMQNLAHWFDFGLFELWTTLLAGGTLCYPQDLLDFSTHPEFLAARRIDTVHSTPSFFRQLLAQGRELGSLALVHLGGEALSRALVRRIEAAVAGGCRVMNGYGPTEAAINCSICALSGRPLDAGVRGATVPIGRVSANNLLHVLDRSGRPVPLGARGELAVGGDGVARGYLNRPALTAASFVPDPFSGVPGSRLYKSGDLVRYLPAGQLEFWGRIDHQVKLRGLRIELDEIESALVALPGISAAVVQVWEPPAAEPAADGGTPAEQRLVAYLVGNPPALEAMRERLRETLPEAMVPSAFVALEALPLTASGKVDRRALPAPDPGGLLGESAGTAPRTPTEELVAGIWAEVLGQKDGDVGPIGSGDNFFHLGGHSLLATQAIARTRRVFGVHFTVRTLFEHPTVAEFAAAVDDAGRGDRLPALEKGPVEDEPVLSFTQERFWFLDQMTEGTNTYSIPFAVRLDGPLHAAALERFFDDLLTRHEVLRATFPSRQGRPIQRISPPARFTLPLVDLGGIAPGEPAQERELLRLVSQAARRPFDLARGPLMRAALVRLRADRHALLVGFHHIVADGWSVRVLIAEAQAAYGAFVAGRPSPLPPLPIQYRDFARWQRSWLDGEALAAEIAHWRARLGERPPVLDLPRYPAVAGHSPQPSSERFHLPPAAAEALRSFSRRRDATLFVTLLAAWSTVLGRTSGQDRVVVGTVVANRNQVEIEGLIGCFVNTLVLPIDLSGDPAFGELVERVRRAALDAYVHQDLPFEKLVEAYNPDRRSIQPLFQAFFTLETPETDLPPLRLPGLEVRGLELVGSGRLEAKLDFAMGAGYSSSGLSVGLGYNAAVYPAEWVKRMVDDYRRVLLHLAEGAPEERLSELPGASADERRAFEQRLAGLSQPPPPAGDEPPRAAAPEKSEQQQLADQRKQLEKRLARLPPALRARFAQRLEKPKEAPERTSEIPRRQGAGPAPLSFAQERLWFIDRFDPGSPAYAIPLVTRFRGPLDVPSLAKSLAALLRRHEILRTVFELGEDGPVQVVRPAADRPLAVVDLRRLADGAAEAAVRLRAEGRRPFDLRRGPLVRHCLFALAGEHVLLLNVHHIVFDGWSTAILVRELRQLYDAFSRNLPSPLAELPIQYADFAVWQRGWLRGERLERLLAWWREKLRGIPPALELPADRPRPAVLDMAGAEESCLLPAGVGADVRRMTQGSGVTPFMVLLASSEALLHRLTGETDLVVGTAIANRNRSAVENLIGFFVNTLVLRTDLSSDPTFGTLVDRVRETTVEAYEYQDLPFEKLVEELQPERNLGQTPLFQVMFAFEDATGDGGSDADSESGPGAEIGASIAKFDLTLAFVERAGGLEALLHYRTCLFDRTTVRRWIGYLERLLAAAVADPDRRLSELPLLAPAERQQLLREWNDPQSRRPPLGRPLNGVELRLVDRHDQPVPIGVAGEICVAGPGGLTAEKYLLVEGRRFFRSGDLGRFLPDGSLESLGRLDHQVRVRGHRIDPAEVEAVLAQQPGISQAVVLAPTDPSSGDRRLVAYVVAGEPLRTGPLQDALAEVLPDYMVPRTFVALETLPLTPGGKVDRAALGRLALEAPAPGAGRGPRDRFELELSRIWEDLLGRGPIGIREDFFGSGGHSLLVSRLQLRIESLCGWRPPVASLFRWSTIEKQAALLRRSDGVRDRPAAASLVALRPSGSRPPLFCVHPGSGHVICYHALARRLDPEQPFLAFQSPGLEGGDGGPETIEGMASAYLAELYSARPEGPCHLAGWSMGGLVALEMARQLLEQGREVASLTLLDTRVPDGSGAELNELGLLAAFALHLGIPADRLPPLSEVERRAGLSRPLASLRELALDLGVLPADFGEADLERFWNVFRRNAEAVRRYLPRPYPRRAFLLAAEEEAAGPARCPDLGWRELIADLTVRKVPGSHFTMVDEPHVEELARVLSELMGEGPG